MSKKKRQRKKKSSTTQMQTVIVNGIPHQIPISKTHDEELTEEQWKFTVWFSIILFLLVGGFCTYIIYSQYQMMSRLGL